MHICTYNHMSLYMFGCMYLRLHIYIYICVRNVSYKKKALYQKQQFSPTLRTPDLAKNATSKLKNAKTSPFFCFPAYTHLDFCFLLKTSKTTQTTPLRSLSLSRAPWGTSGETWMAERKPPFSRARDGTQKRIYAVSKLFPRRCSRPPEDVSDEKL